MNVGLFFGSFNPVHTGHLIIANHLATSTFLDEVWMVISPQNPFKTSKTLLNENHRYFLLQSAVEGEKKIKSKQCGIQITKAFIHHQYANLFKRKISHPPVLHSYG